jgi:hypothetical protein
MLMKVISTSRFVGLLTCLFLLSIIPAPSALADVDGPYKGGLLSLKGEKWEIGGELEVEYRDAQKDASDPDSQFKVDQLYIIPKVTLSGNITLKAEVQVTDSKALLEEGHVTFSGLPGKAFIKVGLEDRFIKRSRITETYPLIGSAFWRDDDLGVQIGGKLDFAYWFVSYTNGLRIASSSTTLTTQKVMEDSGSKFLHEDRNTGDKNENKEVGLGLGRKQDLGRLGKADVLLWAYFGKLNSDEISALNAKLASGGYSSQEDRKNFWGFRVTHKWKNLKLVGEYIDADTGDLDRRGWYIEPSYKLKTPWDRPKSFTFLARFNRLNNDLIGTPGEILTWDWDVQTLAAIIEIEKHVKLKLEYSLVDEDNGGKGIRNDEFLAQLELAF